MFWQLSFRAEVAQVVEQRTENPRVSSSTLLLGTKDRRGAPESLLLAGRLSGSSSAVERLLAKEEVAGSNPVFRSKKVGKLPISPAQSLSPSTAPLDDVYRRGFEAGVDASADSEL